MELSALFECVGDVRHRIAHGERSCAHPDGQTELIIDRFPDDHATCLAIRVRAPSVDVRLAGAYALRACEAGGWILEPTDRAQPSYWLPQLPRQRRYHVGGPIEVDRPAVIGAANASATSLQATLNADADNLLEFAIWQFRPGSESLPAELMNRSAVEEQPYFLYASHTNWTGPSDLYLHLAHGAVYERDGHWPRHWRIRDELDAYAIYLICGALRASTGKRLYGLLQAQTVLAVMSHQDELGAFRHGEWTDDIESHFRMAAGGIHLLAAAFEAMPSEDLADRLLRAAKWLSAQADTLRCGPWLLHDSLEQSAAAMAKSPFRFAPSRALGKSNTNLLVLNTHVDSSLALMRCDEALGAENFTALVGATHRTTVAVLNIRSAEALYRVLFAWIRLTMLPEARARSLPLPMRALKRLAWRWLRPRWHLLKARYPRLVMPGGYIERDLTLASFAVQYLPVNLWDLARLNRKRPDPTLQATISAALCFMRETDLMQTWVEKRRWGSALCYLAEALRVLAIDDQDPQIRHDLVRAVVLSRKVGLGIPPGLLRPPADPTASSERRRAPCPSSPGLVVVDIGAALRPELIAINVGSSLLPLSFDRPPEDVLAWAMEGARPCSLGALIAPGAWAWGRSSGALASEATVSHLPQEAGIAAVA